MSEIKGVKVAGGVYSLNDEIVRAALENLKKQLGNGSLVVGLANAVKVGAITLEMLDEKLKLSVSVVNDLETDDALKPLSANQGKVLKELIDIINGTGEGSTDKKITDAIAKLVDNAPENLDTLKEFAEWIEGHGKEVADILAAINSNARAIANEAARATEAEAGLGKHISQIEESANKTNTDLTEIKKNIASSLHTSGGTDSVTITGKSDVGRTTFSVNIPAATTESAGVMSAGDKKVVDRLNLSQGATYHVEKNFPAHNNGHLITFNALAGQKIIINITISEIVDRAIYYKLFLGDEEYTSFNQPANYNTVTRTIVVENTGEYHIYRNYTVQSTFITTISVEVLSEARSIASDGPFVEVVTKNPKCNSSSGFSLKNCVANSQQPLQLIMSRVNAVNPDIRQSIALNPGSYQVFVTGKLLSISGENKSCGVSNTVGLPYISIPVEAGKEFSIVSNPVHITEDKSGIFYFGMNGAIEGELAVVELYALGIARVDSSYITPSMIAELTGGKRYSFGVDSRIKSGFWGRKWVTLGDSITSQASYQSIVKNELQLGDFVNLGVGGKPVTGDGANSMCQDNYLSQIPSDAGIITIMGGTNDFAQNKELGDFDSTDTTKFCGALNHIIDYITENYPTAMLVVLGTPLGVNWGVFPDTDGLLNGIGLSTLDYGIAAEEVCRRRGVHYISMASCGWSTKNISQFVKNDGADGYSGAYFHPNKDGGRRIAAVIVGGLRRIEPVMQYYR